MDIECTDKIPADEFKTWHEILCSTGGRYLSNPYLIGDVVRVHYGHFSDGYRKLQELYARTRIKTAEVRKDQKWRVILRRLAAVFKRKKINP